MSEQEYITAIIGAGLRDLFDGKLLSERQLHELHEKSGNAVTGIKAMLLLQAIECPESVVGLGALKWLWSYWHLRAVDGHLLNLFFAAYKHGRGRECLQWLCDVQQYDSTAYANALPAQVFRTLLECARQSDLKTFEWIVARLKLTPEDAVERVRLRAEEYPRLIRTHLVPCRDRALLDRFTVLFRVPRTVDVLKHLLRFASPVNAAARYPGAVSLRWMIEHWALPFDCVLPADEAEYVRLFRNVDSYEDILSNPDIAVTTLDLLAEKYSDELANGAHFRCRGLDPSDYFTNTDARDWIWEHWRPPRFATIYHDDD